MAWLKTLGLKNNAPNPATGTPAGTPPFAPLNTDLKILSEFPDPNNADGQASYPCLVVELQDEPRVTLFNGVEDYTELLYDPAHPGSGPWQAIVTHVQGFTVYPFTLCVVSKGIVSDQTPNNTVRDIAGQLRTALRRPLVFDATDGGAIPDPTGARYVTTFPLLDQPLKAKAGAQLRTFEMRFKLPVLRSDFSAPETVNTLREIIGGVYNYTDGPSSPPIQVDISPQ